MVGKLIVNMSEHVVFSVKGVKCPEEKRNWTMKSVLENKLELSFPALIFSQGSNLSADNNSDYLAN